MARRKKKKGKGEDTTQRKDHLTCQICKHLDDVESVGYAWGKKWGEFPEQAEGLMIVGAPFFEFATSSSSRYRILQQCPHCGTFYRFEYDYEFMGVGFEDDYTLARLSDKEGIEWAKKNFAIIYNETPPEEEADWQEKEKKIFQFEFII